MISRKPTRQEYITISKVTGLGICLLGFVGFVIHVPITYLKALIKP
jgi:protein transport protein SEC61 subunit gamma-like protein